MTEPQEVATTAGQEALRDVLRRDEESRTGAA